jgi:hypothetical protein
MQPLILLHPLWKVLVHKRKGGEDIGRGGKGGVKKHLPIGGWDKKIVFIFFINKNK